MPESMTAALIAIFLWWLTTGAILFAVTTLAARRMALAAAAGVLLIGGLLTLHLTAEEVSAAGDLGRGGDQFPGGGDHGPQSQGIVI